MKLEDLETSCKRLPTFPAVAVKVLETLKKDAFTINEVSDIISADIALTTKMLRMANSAFYERTTPVRSVKDAFMVIGMERAKSVAIAYTVKEALTFNLGNFDFEFFWKNSLTAAIASEYLSKILGHYRHNEYFLLGFLLDIGVVILYNHDPETYKLILEEKKETGDKLHLIEEYALGLNHQDAARYVLKIWDFPESIYLPISKHHNPQDLRDVDEDAVMAINILNVVDLARDIYYGYEKSGKIAKIYSTCAEKFSLMPKDIDEFMDTVGKETKSIVEFFDINPSDIKSYVEIIKEANKELVQIIMEEIDNKEDTRQLIMANKILRETYSATKTPKHAE